MFPLLAQLDAVLRDVVAGQLDIGEDGMGGNVGVVYDAVRPQSLDLGARQDPARPGAGGDHHVGDVGDGARLLCLAVLVLDALDGRLAVVDLGHLGAEADVDAPVARQGGDGCREVEGVHLRRLGLAGRAHLLVVLDEAGVDPVEVRRQRRVLQ